MTRTRILLILLVTLLALALLQADTLAQPTFEATACPFDLPPGAIEGEDVDCGYVSVPEDHASPDGRQIKLAVAIIHPPGGATHPDPIVYLSGGPGGSRLMLLNLMTDSYPPMFALERDLIIFDQRGVGYSQPALVCPEMVELLAELFDYEWQGEALDAEGVRELKVDTLTACRDDLSEIADLSRYHTAQNAADVADLRAAMGYDEINLYGSSYGTLLALEVMRSHPEGIRSVILDAPYTPAADLYLALPGNFARALESMFVDCAAEAACNAAYPDLRAVFTDVLDQLRSRPYETNVIHPFNRTRYPLLLNDDMFLYLMFRGLYITELRPLLPQIIYAAHEGTFDVITQIAQRELLLHSVQSWGMYLSVLCHDEIAFSSVDQFRDAVAEHPEYEGFFSHFEAGELTYAICERWGAGEADASANADVISDIPTLLFTGASDPIVAPNWGRDAAAHLTNGYYFSFPGYGHGVGASHACPLSMIIAFVTDPTHTPDASCMDEMEVAAFALPAEETAVEMEPFTQEDMSISGLAPVGWTAAGPGAFVRGRDVTDVTALIQQRAPVSLDDVTALLAAQLGLDELPESSATREANGQTWTIYALEVQGIAVDAALAQVGDTTLIILMNSTMREHDALYEQVFLPAVDALVPLEE